MAAAVDAEEIPSHIHHHTQTQIPSLSVPVFHEANFPFAGDLLCGTLCGEGWGRGHDHPRGDGAGRGCSDLISLDVTRGS